MQASKIQYLLDREQQETVAYLDATDPRIRDVHQELAERYAEAIWEIQETEIAASLARPVVGND